MQLVHALALSAIVVVAASPAYGGQGPTVAERALIAQTLQNAGYVGWDDIELASNGRWEIEDAQALNGARHDLMLDLKTATITRAG